MDAIVGSLLPVSHRPATTSRAGSFVAHDPMVGKTFWIIKSVSIIQGLILHFLWLLVPYLMEERGMDYIDASTIVNLFWACVAIGPFFCQILMDHFGHFPVALVTNVSLCAGLFFLGILDNSKPIDASRIICLVLLLLGLWGQQMPLDDLVNEEEKPTIISKIGVVLLWIVIHTIGVCTAALEKEWVWSIRFFGGAVALTIVTIIFFAGRHSYRVNDRKRRRSMKVALKSIWRAICLSGSQTSESTVIILRKIVVIFQYLGIGFLSCVGNTYFVQQATLLSPLYPIYLRVFYFSLKEIFGLCYHYITNNAHSVVRQYLGLLGIGMSLLCGALSCLVGYMLEWYRVKGGGDMPFLIIMAQFVLLAAVDGISEKAVEVYFSVKNEPVDKYFVHLSTIFLGIGMLVNVVSSKLIEHVVTSMKGDVSEDFKIVGFSLGDYFHGLGIIGLIFSVCYALWCCGQSGLREDRSLLED